MRHILSFLALTLLALPMLLVSCQPEAPEAPAAAPEADIAYTPVGADITADDAMPIATVVAAPGDYTEQNVKLEGTVREVCQNAGCWLTLDAGEGNNIRVNVAKHDDGSYAFTFPKDISGRTVILEGWLEATTLDVETQVHLAEDAGETVDPSTLQPKQELQLTANGALIKA